MCIMRVPSARLKDSSRGCQCEHECKAYGAGRCADVDTPSPRSAGQTPHQPETKLDSRQVLFFVCTLLSPTRAAAAARPSPRTSVSVIAGSRGWRGSSQGVSSPARTRRGVGSNSPSRPGELSSSGSQYKVLIIIITRIIERWVNVVFVFCE